MNIGVGFQKRVNLIFSLLIEGVYGVFFRSAPENDLFIK